MSITLCNMDQVLCAHHLTALASSRSPQPEWCFSNGYLLGLAEYYTITRDNSFLNNKLYAFNVERVKINKFTNESNSQGE